MLCTAEERELGLDKQKEGGRRETRQYNQNCGNAMFGLPSAATKESFFLSSLSCGFGGNSFCISKEDIYPGLASEDADLVLFIIS